MKKRGFTLIELIVVVLIMIIIIGMSLASYNNFNEEKKLDSDADKLTDILEMARKKSIAAEIVAPCTSFQGYAVDISTSSYKLQQCCDDSCTDFSSYNLAGTNQVISGIGNIRFKPLLGEISNDNLITIENKITTKSISINISPLGIIEEGHHE